MGYESSNVSCQGNLGTQTERASQLGVLLDECSQARTSLHGALTTSLGDLQTSQLLIVELTAARDAALADIEGLEVKLISQESQIGQLQTMNDQLTGQLEYYEANCITDSELALCEQSMATCQEDLVEVTTNASFLYVYPQAYAANAAGLNPNEPKFPINENLLLHWIPTPIPSSSLATFNSYPDLPPGLSIDHLGNIIGIPTQISEATTYTITLNAVGAPEDAIPLVTSRVRFAITPNNI